MPKLSFLKTALIAGLCLVQLACTGKTVSDRAINSAADNRTGSAKLSWNPNKEPNLSGYKIYYRKSHSKKYEKPIVVGNKTTYTVTGLKTGTRYYFAVTAYNVYGIESGFSNIVYKDIR